MHETQKYHGVSNLTMDTLPKIGFIVLKNSIPISAGFLRKLEPCYGQIDTLVSNAEKTKEERHEALEIVVNCLIHFAKENGIKGLVCHTKDEGILKRAKSLGFHVVPEQIIAKMI